MPGAPGHAAFVASLRREITAFGEFIELLRAEQECLVKAEIDPLLDISSRKAEKVEELGELSRLRCAFLEAHALPASAGGMQQWIQSRKGGRATEVSGLWEQLSGFAADARRINSTNGTLINNRMAYNRDALTALSGSAHATGEYAKDGSASIRLGHRDFGAA